MRIAILIGVSEYAGNANNLPACKQDLDSMAAVVEAAEKFDEILRFAGSVKASDLKTTISQKIDSLRGADVEEIFFYYTGHGCSIVVLISKRAIRFFYFFTEYVEKNWADREQRLNFTWKTNEFPLIEEQQILDFVSALHSQFAGWVVEQVRKRFPKTESAGTT